MAQRLKIIFAGTPAFAAAALTAIHAEGFEVPLVLTQPDRPAGRGMKYMASPVKQYALEAGLALIQPPSLRTGGQCAEHALAAIERLRATPHDVMVVAAYGLLLPQTVLNLRRMAVSIFMPHCCRAGVAQRRFSARLQRAILNRALARCRWTLDSIPARFFAVRPFRSMPRIPPRP